MGPQMRREKRGLTKYGKEYSSTNLQDALKGIQNDK
jgi:hypothetical protein